MKLKKIIYISIIAFISFLYSCCSPNKGGFLTPIPYTTPLGKYFKLSCISSTSKTWIALAYYVAKNISYHIKDNPKLGTKAIYIVPKKGSLFEETFAELLTSALSNYRLLLLKNKNSKDCLIIKYNTYLIYNKNMELIVNTSLYDKNKLIFRDSSSLYITNQTILNYIPKNQKDTIVPSVITN